MRRDIRVNAFKVKLQNFIDELEEIGVELVIGDHVIEVYGGKIKLGEILSFYEVEEELDS